MGGLRGKLCESRGGWGAAHTEGQEERERLGAHGLRCRFPLGPQHSDEERCSSAA